MAGLLASDGIRFVAPATSSHELYARLKAVLSWHYYKFFSSYFISF